MTEQEVSNSSFAALYKTWATDRLLDVVDNPSNYQPLAVEAAKLELERRHLTQEQLAAAKEEQKVRQQSKVDKQQKAKDIESKLKSFGSSVANAVNPIQKETLATEKIIKLISLFIGGLFLYLLYEKFGAIWFMLTDTSSQWDISAVLYFLPFIILPIASLLLWFKRKMGWILTTIYCSYTAAGAASIFIMELTRKPTGIAALDTFFPTTSPILYIGMFLLFGGLTWTLCKENMRAVYQADKKSMLIALGIGIGLVLLMAISGM